MSDREIDDEATHRTLNAHGF